MISIITIIQLYIAILVVTIIHELGHDLLSDGKIGGSGRIKIKKLFPIPQMYSQNARSRYGGLIFNAITAIIIMITEPQIIFLQIIGLISFLYLVLYLITGSILPEPRPSTVPKNFAFDDIPNKKWPAAVGMAILFIIGLGPYYLEIIKGII